MVTMRRTSRATVDFGPGANSDKSWPHEQTSECSPLAEREVVLIIFRHRGHFRSIEHESVKFASLPGSDPTRWTSQGLQSPYSLNFSGFHISVFHVSVAESQELRQKNDGQKNGKRYLFERRRLGVTVGKKISQQIEDLRLLQYVDRSGWHIRNRRLTPVR
jgi:hypothetical protein